MVFIRKKKILSYPTLGTKLFSSDGAIINLENKNKYLNMKMNFFYAVDFHKSRVLS